MARPRGPRGGDNEPLAVPEGAQTEVEFIATAPARFYLGILMTGSRG